MQLLSKSARKTTEIDEGSLVARYRAAFLYDHGHLMEAVMGNTKNRKVRLPLSFYVNNSLLAEKVMKLISARDGELPGLTMKNIQEMASRHEQECMGEPTFAKALIDLIEKVNTVPEHKLNMILELARVTIYLRNLMLS
ncbi:MAG: hypothetical protein ACE5HO_10375 [bacterium]